MIPLEKTNPHFSKTKPSSNNRQMSLPAKKSKKDRKVRSARGISSIKRGIQKTENNTKMTLNGLRSSREKLEKTLTPTNLNLLKILKLPVLIHNNIKTNKMMMNQKTKEFMINSKRKNHLTVTKSGIKGFMKARMLTMRTNRND